jgi:hypothetical protein
LTLKEIVALLGTPVAEHGPSTYTAYSKGRLETEIRHISRSLEFRDVSPAIVTLLVHERDDGFLEFQFRGRELVHAD